MFTKVFSSRNIVIIVVAFFVGYIGIEFLCPKPNKSPRTLAEAWVDINLLEEVKSEDFRPLYLQHGNSPYKANKYKSDKSTHIYKIHDIIKTPYGHTAYVHRRTIGDKNYAVEYQLMIVESDRGYLVDNIVVNHLDL